MTRACINVVKKRFIPVLLQRQKLVIWVICGQQRTRSRNFTINSRTGHGTLDCVASEVQLFESKVENHSYVGQYDIPKKWPNLVPAQWLDGPKQKLKSCVSTQVATSSKHLNVELKPGRGPGVDVEDSGLLFGKASW